MLCILSLGIDWIAISIDHSSRIQSNTSYSPASVDLLDRFIDLRGLAVPSIMVREAIAPTRRVRTSR